MKWRPRKPRRAPIGRLVLLSLGTAGVFGVNSIFFFISQNHLGNIAGTVENLQALDQSIENDRADILPALADARRRCLARFPTGCEAYVEALLLVRYRSDDYIAALKADFQASDNDEVIVDLKSASSVSGSVAGQGFGLSFLQAKRIGITTPRDYISYVSTHLHLTNVGSYVAESEQMAVVSQKAFDALSKFSSAYSKTASDFQAAQSATNALYVVITAAEILLFLLVATISLLNARAEALSRQSSASEVCQ